MSDPIAKHSLWDIISGKVWFTADELAEMRLPGLPTSASEIEEMARRDGWSGRPIASNSNQSDDSDPYVLKLRDAALQIAEVLRAHPHRCDALVRALTIIGDVAADLREARGL